MHCNVTPITEAISLLLHFMNHAIMLYVHCKVPTIIAAILLQVLHSMNHAIMLLCPLQCSPNYWSNIAISTAIYESCSNAWRNIGSSIALYMNHAVMLLCALRCSPNHWSNTATSTAHYESCRNAAMCIAMFPQLLKQYCYKYYTL